MEVLRHIKPTSSKDAEAVTGAAAAPATPIRVSKETVELCAEEDPSGPSPSQSRKGVAVTEASWGDPIVEVRPRREIDVARRWKAPRVRQSTRAFASAGRRRPSGMTAVAFGWQRECWATSSLIDVSAKAVARGFWEDFFARRSDPPNGRRFELVPSANLPRGSDKGCSDLFQVGVNPSGRCRASGRGSSGPSVSSTPELGRFGWCPPQGGASSVASQVRLRCIAESEGSWSCPWFHTTAEADGHHVASCSSGE